MFMLTNKLKRFGQSKFIPILLTVLLLFLPLLTSCSRRSQYEDQLESIKDTRPEIPLEEKTAKDGFIGSPSEDYALPIINKTGETPYFSGKTEDELKTMWRKKMRCGLRSVSCRRARFLGISFIISSRAT